MKIKRYTITPKVSYIDTNALTRLYLEITFSSLSDHEYNFMRDVTNLQYSIPMKYLQKQKWNYTIDRQPGIVSTPLNQNIIKQISTTPINQSIPIDTTFSIKLNPKERYTVNSNDIKYEDVKLTHTTTLNIEKYNLKPNKELIIHNTPYSTIEMTSNFEANFIVSEVDLEDKQYSLFGFYRDDDEKKFTIWCYYVYNVTPDYVLTHLNGHEKIVKEILK